MNLVLFKPSAPGASTLVLPDTRRDAAHEVDGELLSLSPKPKPSDTSSGEITCEP